MFMNGGPPCDNFWRASSSHHHHQQPHFHPRTSYYNLRTSAVTASEKPPSAERTGLNGIQATSTVVPTTSQSEVVRGQQMVNNEHHAVAGGQGDPLLLAELKKCLVMFRIPKPPSAGSSGREKSKTIWIRNGLFRIRIWPYRSFGSGSDPAARP